MRGSATSLPPLYTELAASKQHAEEIRALGTVRLPPVWERVHSSPLQAARTLRSSGGLSPTRGRSPTFGSAAATPRRGDDEFGGVQVDIPVTLRRPTSPAPARTPGRADAGRLATRGTA